MTCAISIHQNGHVLCGTMATRLVLLDGRKIPACPRHGSAYDDLADREQWPKSEPINPVVHDGI